MRPKKVDYNAHVRGDTINARRFTISQTVDDSTSPVDLTGADIKVDFVLGSSKLKKTIGNGITIIDAANGVFQVDRFKLSREGIWNYDIEITFPDGTVKTWIKGKINILNDVTK